MYKCIYNKVIIGEGWNWNNREWVGGGGEVFGMYENSCILFLVCYRLKGVQRIYFIWYILRLNDIKIIQIYIIIL